MTAPALHTPLLGGKSTRSGRGLYEKMLLPAGKTLTVNGQKLALTPELFGQIKQSFDAGFMDVTPFCLVDEKNSHTDAPDNVRGRVRDLSVKPDGLYGLIDAPDDLFTHNPDLPVSVRLKFDQERADGRKAPVVLAHVAGTNDPHVGGMKTWQRVTDLSADPTPVVDLTAATYQGDSMATLSDADLAKLQKLLASLPDDDTSPEQPAAETGDELSDDELEQIIGELGDLDGDEYADDTADEPVAASLSAGDMSAIDLANATAAEAVNRLDSIEAELAAERWKNRANALVQDGVPPFLVNLAAPILGAPDSVDLSADDSTDPRKVIAQMLDQAKGLVDLSSSERGTSVGQSKDDHTDFIAAWRANFS